MDAPALISDAYLAFDRIRNSVRRRILTALPQRGRPPAGSHASAAWPAPCLAGLKEAGLVILRREGLRGLLTPAEREVLDDLCGRAAATGADRTDWSSLSLDDIWTAFPQVFRLGLSPAILDLVEGYLGEPCLYLGSALKCEKVDGVVEGNRHWHLDVEDERMCRILVYLNAVGGGGGPFEYASVGASDAGRARRPYRSGYLTDADFGAMTPGGQATAFYGEAGDAIVFDGARIFHRAQPPAVSPRYSVTFAYVSRHPLELRLTTRLSRANELELRQRLDPRQAACLPRARRI